MAKENDENCDKKWSKKGWHKNHGVSSAVYGLGFIGAAVYFISVAPTFWIGVLGFLKALVWPAFLVYQAFQFLAG